MSKPMTAKPPASKTQGIEATPLSERSKRTEQYYYEKDHEMVRGRFHFHEARRGEKAVLKFDYRKYKQDDVLHCEYVDHEIITIPYMIAKHLNFSGWVITHEHRLDTDGKSKQKKIKKTKRYSFENLDFMIDDDYMPKSGLVEINQTG